MRATTRGWSVAVLTAAGLLGAVLWVLSPRTPPDRIDGAAASLVRALAERRAGFADASTGWEYAFPRDYGPHAGYQAELWGLNGSLVDGDGRRTGLRLRFARLGLAPPGRSRPSALAADAVMAAQLLLAGERDRTLQSAQRLGRIALGLAGASVDPTRVWLEGWTLEHAADGHLQVRAQMDGVDLDLRLRPGKAAVTAADAGLFDAVAAAGAAPGDAVLNGYLLPRLALEGELRIAGETRAVSGQAWLEHAWGTLPAGLAGTRGQLAVNRFALQLDDGMDLFCMQTRRRGGGGTPIPTCLTIAPDGTPRLFQRRDLTLAPIGARWRAPGTGAEYPLHWRLAIPQLGLELQLTPLLEAQELLQPQPSWSGAVIVTGDRGGQPVTGAGFIDLTGYDAFVIETGGA